MQWPRLRAVFPWRTALLMAMVPAIALTMFMAWFRWELQPLEKYYLWAYWESSENAKRAGTTTHIEWLIKTAQGRKSQLVVDADVVPGGKRNPSFELSPSALGQGWAGLEKSAPQSLDSTKLEEFLKEDFYGNLDFRELIIQPLLGACIAPIIVLYLAFVMKRELTTEWSRIWEEVSESEWVFNLSEDRDHFVRRIRSGIGRRIWVEKAEFQQDYSGAEREPYSAINPSVVRKTESSTLKDEKPAPLSSPKKPPQQHAIFPGTASVRAVNEQSKPWDESEWID